MHGCPWIYGCWSLPALPVLVEYAGISDVIGFHGESVAELKAAFEEAVEDYLATCKK
jgi:hypothetical protein